MFWNSGASKMATNCEIGCGPRGSSLRPPTLTANFAAIVSRSRSATDLVSWIVVDVDVIAPVFDHRISPISDLFCVIRGLSRG